MGPRQVVCMKPEVIGIGQLPTDVIVASIVFPPEEEIPTRRNGAPDLLLQGNRTTFATRFGAHLEHTGSRQFLANRFEVRRTCGVLESQGDALESYNFV